jgi:hypothetical protein
MTLGKADCGLFEIVNLGMRSQQGFWNGVLTTGDRQTSTRLLERLGIGFPSPEPATPSL